MKKSVKGIVVAGVLLAGVSGVSGVEAAKKTKCEETYGEVTAYVLKGRETYRGVNVLGGKAFVSKPSYYRDALLTLKDKKASYTFHVPSYKNKGTFYVVDAKDAGNVMRGLKKIPKRYSTVAFTTDKRMIGASGSLSSSKGELTLQLTKSGKKDVFTFKTTTYR